MEWYPYTYVWLGLFSTHENHVFSWKYPPGGRKFEFQDLKKIYFILYYHRLLIDTHIKTPRAFVDHFSKIHDFQENDVIIPGNIGIFGGASTQINYFGLRNVCAKNHAFSTICAIFAPFSLTSIVFSVFYTKAGWV